MSGVGSWDPDETEIDDALLSALIAAATQLEDACLGLDDDGGSVGRATNASHALLRLRSSFEYTEDDAMARETKDLASPGAAMRYYCRAKTATESLFRSMALTAI